MIRTSVLAFFLVLMAAAVHAQQVRIPYQLSLGVGYLASYGDWIGVQDEEGEGPDSVWSQGSGNTRIAIDGTINMGARRRFGLGLAYRRFGPDNGYAINGVGPVIAWTNPYSANVVSQWMLAGGYASLAVDDVGLDDSVYNDISYGASFGAFFELQWRLAFPVIDLTEFSNGQALRLAPHFGLATGAAFTAREVDFETLPGDEQDYFLYVDNFNTTISLGVTLMVMDED